jgi:hypothetical protein
MMFWYFIVAAWIGVYALVYLVRDGRDVRDEREVDDPA